MILSAISKQFTLKDDGQIYFQPDSTNPLPGEPLAVVRKGEMLLQPMIEILATRDLGAEDRNAVTEHVATWLKAHIYTVLEPLFALVVDETLPEPVREIALKLFAGVGIVPRGDVEEPISKLDAEMRKVLRDKKVRLGPLLIFIPDLNKPAAVHLRALLWSLYNDVVLPAPVPRDGAMSVTVETEGANPDFYRAIGYPLYGPRAVRIDMLDRVINAVYDGAKDGKFQAQHSMAEWMGCPIADLYGVLEAMGHKRIETPVAEVPVEVAPVVEDSPKEEAAPQEQPAEATTEVVAEEKKQEQKKPDLDFFILRRGKAHGERKERPPRAEHHHAPADKPAFPKERYAPKGVKKTDRKSDDEDGEHKKFKKKKFDDRKKDREARNEPRVYKAEAADHDNPFAVLQNLKLK
ncbi:MAG TPA: hypothetical protein PKI93_03570 [Alphaproteobacteria bacterium]|nr:hypothetical protein [Alphaproteobacteria bacterium]